VISHRPPDVSASEVCDTVYAFGTTRYHNPISDVNDHTTGVRGTRIHVRLTGDADPAEAALELGRMWGLHTELQIELGRPLTGIMRDWYDPFHGDDLAERLALIQSAVN
jgi:hypothetical protein